MKRKTLYGAYLILFLDNLGFGILYSLFPYLFLNPAFEFLEMNSTPTTRYLLLGFLLASGPLAQFFGNPFFGDISDQWGRKRTLAITLAGTFLGSLLTAGAVMAKFFLFLLFSRLIAGFFSSNLAICLATIIDATQESEQKKRNGIGTAAALLGISWTLAILSGPFFMLYLDWKLHSSLPFWLLSLLPCLSLGILWLFFQETISTEGASVKLFKGFYRILNVLETKQSHLLYCVLFFWFLGFLISFQWLTPIATEKFRTPEDAILKIIVLFGLVWAFSASVINRYILASFSCWHLSFWSLLFLSLAYFFSGASSYFLYFEIAYLISAAIAAIAWINHFCLLGTQGQQGKAMGLALGIIAFVQCIGPILGGLIAGFMLEPIFYVCALLVFIGFLILSTYMIHHRKMHA